MLIISTSSCVGQQIDEENPVNIKVITKSSKVLTMKLCSSVGKSEMWR